MTKILTRCIALTPREAAAFALPDGGRPSLLVRPIVPQPPGEVVTADFFEGVCHFQNSVESATQCWPDGTAHLKVWTVRCPWGARGTRLVGREAWAVSDAYDRYLGGAGFTIHVGTVAYAAGGGLLNGQRIERTCFDVDGGRGRWRSPATLPASLARTHLRLLSVRAVRVSAISEEDAQAAGYKHEVVTSKIEIAASVFLRDELEQRGGKSDDWAWLLSVAPWDGEAEATSLVGTVRDPDSARRHYPMVSDDPD